ncbi:MAG: transporter substrate-binding domain-containing protein, partial [Ottowia sp.]|nr:transporter substrate-binding domain-containing protein [Ottowia sp.]
MRKLLFSIFSALLIAAAPAQAADKLVNGIDANFPPFAFVDASGKPSGFDVDAMDWVAKDMGVQVTHQPMEWDGIVTSLVTKKIDIIASGMTINEERAKQVAF